MERKRRRRHGFSTSVHATMIASNFRQEFIKRYEIQLGSSGDNGYQSTMQGRESSGYVQSMGNGVRPGSSKRPGSSSFGRNAPAATSTSSGIDLSKSYAYIPPIIEETCREELKESLRPLLIHVSRQRLRAILIGFRRNGGIENRISVQNLQSVLSEHNVTLPSRVVLLIKKAYEGKFGIDFEPLWKVMVSAQALTGRDSVQTTANPDVIVRKQSFVGYGNDPKDKELIQKLHYELASSPDHDLDELRTICEEKDRARHGVLPRKVLKKICEEQRLPVSRSILNTLLSRCDDEKNGIVSWTEFVTILEKAALPLEEPNSPDNSHPAPRVRSGAHKTACPSKTYKIPPAASKEIKISDAVSIASSVDDNCISDNPDDYLADSFNSSLSRSLNLSDSSKKFVKDKKAFLKDKEKQDESSKETKKLSKNLPPTTKQNGGKTRPQSGALNKAVKPRQAKQLKKVVSSPSTVKPFLSAEGDSGSDKESKEGTQEKVQQTLKKILEESVGNESGEGGIKKELEKAPVELGVKLDGNPDEGKDTKVSGDTDLVTNANTSCESETQMKALVKNDTKPEKSDIQDHSKVEGEHSKEQDKKIEAEQIEQEFLMQNDKLEKCELLSGPPVSKDDANLMSEIVVLQQEGKDEAAKEQEKIKKNEMLAPADGHDLDDKSPAIEAEPEHVTISSAGRVLKFFTPSHYIGIDLPKGPPEQDLILDWVYGYRGNDCRNNLFTLASGELVYFTAELIVLYDPAQHKQRHYTEHTASIKRAWNSDYPAADLKFIRCSFLKFLAVHPNGQTVASGQADTIKTKASVRIWLSTTLQTTHILGEGTFQKEVTCLEFAPAHGYLLAVDNTKQSTLSVWDWKNNEKFAEASIGADVVCQVRFQPKDPNHLISVGLEHMSFWKLDKEEGKLDEVAKANYEKNMKSKYVICVTFRPNGDVVTGDSNGTVYVWPRKGNTISQVMNHVHEGPVFALQFLRGLLLTGGRDGKLLAWNLANKAKEPVGSIQLPPESGGIRMLAISGYMLFIGTTMNCIHHITVTSSGSPFDLSGSIATVTQGHYDEATCVTVYPHSSKEGHFITCGYDGIISMVDGFNHKPLWRYWLKGSNFTSIDVNSSRKWLAIGNREAALLLLEVKSGTCKDLAKLEVIDNSAITCVRFATSGKKIAVGLESGTIHIVHIHDSGTTLKKITTLETLKTPISAFDWAVKDPYLRASTYSGEFFVWNTETWDYTGDHLLIGDVEWMSQNCLLGYHTAGLWNDSSITLPKTIDVEEALLIYAASGGHISLVRYPCHTKMESKVFPAFSPFVSMLRFIPRTGHVISLGCRACCTIQWKIQ